MRSLAQRLENGAVLPCAGVAEPAQSFVTALLSWLLPRRVIVAVTDNLKAQEILHQDVETYLQSMRGTAGKADTGRSLASSFYPAWEVAPHEPGLPHVDVLSDRLNVLTALLAPPQTGLRNPGPIITTVTALLQRTFSPSMLKAGTRSLSRGDRVDPLELVEWLEEQGYEPEAQVTQKGELAVRGGIVDVFPLTSLWPARLEFFGDELESLRCFDPLTQKSVEEITRLTLPPGGELGILRRFRDGNGLRGDGGVQVSDASRPGTLVEYLPRDAIFILCEPGRLAERAEEYARQVPNDHPLFVSWEELQREIHQAQLPVLCLADSDESERDSPSAAPAENAGLPAGAADALRFPQFQDLDSYRPLTGRAQEPQVAEAQRREFFQQLHRWLRQDYAVHVFCNNEGERQRFDEIWGDLSPRFPADPEGAGSASPPPLPQVHLGALSRGFLCEAGKFAVVTDAEIFGRYKVQRPRQLKSAHAQAARSALDIDFTELEEGDLVVHVQHGIARYLGLKTLPSASAAADGHGMECLVLEFAPAVPGQTPPKLYVPVSEAHLVSKYVGAGKAHPPLNTLGGGRWAKAMEQAERAVRDVAADLLSIQAARESQPGHAFAPDTSWQREFESAFIFEETPDQLAAIRETKADMERAKPMDRLICGDVGFGKTEVAIRAAFKAVMGGRQVAVLVPTTVLAQQHFSTFSERMADYPVRIELLSRFRTRGQQQRTVRDLAAGAVDIVIGTHRLLQDDVAFKDLGLVVIDEEQRFGVMHKERFKLLRKLVDVLTLSATPIPRTLYLALSGARDMSTIQTPPHDRLPVETLVAQYDERIIRDAIQRELNRGGQVFFLHNRVITIHTMEQKLRALLPRARIVVGHGQMHSDELEEVMTRFVSGDADVLLSTTIIESGLDIPNANTIIIDRADRFGLSDLYQLRGRVGRYKHQAYAYLLLPRHAGLLSDVRKRLGAIKQYSALGSGFKIAMRDLEIRGAGNLLGSEQSGHITAVGFELYCQLLKQSIAAIKGEKVKPRVDVEVRLDFLDVGEARPDPGEGRPEPAPGASKSALHTPSETRSTAAVPHSYISEPRHRIEMYRKLAQATDKASLESLAGELRDRFGPPPREAQLLLQLGELKILAGERGIRTLEVRDDKLMLTRQGDYITLGGKFPRLTKKEASARLKEIKRFLLALDPGA